MENSGGGVGIEWARDTGVLKYNKVTGSKRRKIIFSKVSSRQNLKVSLCQWFLNFLELFHHLQ